MAKKDDRPIDTGLAGLTGKDEAAAIEFWTERLKLTASIPSDVARVGALTPQLRELTRLGDAERERLTKARLIAFARLPADQRERLAAARTAAWQVDRAVLERDEALVKKLLPGLDASVRSVYPVT
ncbi:MAG TPA: hypothetical protein VHG53_00925 [Candidatus Limnocylindria bacterium]|nr:hypothetical protein [Candidatus Limnocylindria bacterium]